jgi:predicted RNA-binding protein with PUA-like domain
MPIWLLKTEPGEFSFADLANQGVAHWDGVSNAAALIHLRSMAKGDDALIYHTGDEKAIVGLATVARGPYEDPDQPGRTPDGRPKFAVVDLKAVKAARTPLTLADIKADGRFAEFALVKQSRLSVMPVPAPLDRIIRQKTGL